MLGIDLTNVKDVAYGVMPEGKYLVIADHAEVKTTKHGTGEYISVKFKILDGEYEGRTIFHMFNVKNPSDESVRIGREQLKAFINCAGSKMTVLNTVFELIGLRCQAVVKVKTDSYGDKNVISSFKVPPGGVVLPKITSQPLPPAPF